MTLGENLQKLRKSAGLSQEEVAGRLFVSRQSVSKWENDQAEPGVENLKALAALYGVTMDQLTGMAPPSASEVWGSDQDVEEETKRISNYRYLVISRSVIMVLSNLYSVSAYGRIDFPFDWIFMLVGLGVRQAWVYWLIIALDGIGLLFSALTLLSGVRNSILGLIFGTLLLFACTRNEVRGYFHLPEKKEGDQ